MTVLPSPGFFGFSNFPARCGFSSFAGSGGWWQLFLQDTHTTKSEAAGTDAGFSPSSQILPQACGFKLDLIRHFTCLSNYFLWGLQTPALDERGPCYRDSAARPHNYVSSNPCLSPSHIYTLTPIYLPLNGSALKTHFF